jgi:hypothetical protein
MAPYAGNRQMLKRELVAEMPALLKLARRYRPLFECEPLATAILQLDARLKQEHAENGPRIDVALRPNQCRLVRAEVGGAFPQCKVTTNDDMNAGTPLVVTCRWPDGHKQLVRADHVYETNDEARDFANRAVDRLKRWRRGVDAGVAEPQEPEPAA